MRWPARSSSPRLSLRSLHRSLNLSKQNAIDAASGHNGRLHPELGEVCGGVEEFHQGRMNEARHSARALMQVGRSLDDPRSTGLGLCVLALISLLSDEYGEALDYSEQSIALAVTPFDRETALNIKGCVLTLLRRTDEGSIILELFRRRCSMDGDLHPLTTSDAILGVSKVIQGDISGGIRWLEGAISKRESEGYVAAADWYRLFLGEVYLQIIARDEKVPFSVLLKNSPGSSQGDGHRALANSRANGARFSQSTFQSRWTYTGTRTNDSWSTLQDEKQARTCFTASQRSKAYPLSIRADFNASLVSKRLSQS